MKLSLQSSLCFLLVAVIGTFQRCQGRNLDSVLEVNHDGEEIERRLKKDPPHLDSEAPSSVPTNSHSEAPSSVPTNSHSEAPSYVPTSSQTNTTASSPTTFPNESLSEGPTTHPTLSAETVEPIETATGAPTENSTNASTEHPTNNPTTVASTVASNALSEASTDTPTYHPTNKATTVATNAPTETSTTDAPTYYPTDKPTYYPTDKPTYYPTDKPTNVVTNAPTKAPTNTPTVMASSHPTTTPSSSPSAAPSLSPSEAPSPAPSETPECIEDLSLVYDMELNIQDTSIRRKYWLCPDTEFNMGYLDDNGGIVDGQSYIMLRPNVIYQCGMDGSRSNNCTINGGDFALTSFYGVFDGIQETVDNAIIQGLTFSNQRFFAAVLEVAGDVTFVDCAFINQENVAPVLIQWNGEGPSESTSRNLRSTDPSIGLKGFYNRRVLNLPTLANAPRRQLSDAYPRNLEEGLQHKVTFQETVFKDNRANSEIGIPAIIENTYQSQLVIDNCLFENNDYGESSNPAPFGHAIRSFGPVDMESTCFVDNTFFRDGPVVVYGGAYTSINNYASPSDSLKCGLMALFYSPSGMLDEGVPTCVESDVDACAVKLAPTVAPTQAPTEKPTTTFSRIIRVPSSATRISGYDFAFCNIAATTTNKSSPRIGPAKFFASQDCLEAVGAKIRAICMWKCFQISRDAGYPDNSVSQFEDRPNQQESDFSLQRAMTTTIMFLSQRYMRENERLRQELRYTHEKYGKQIAEKEATINELREQLTNVSPKSKSGVPPLESPTSIADFSEGDQSLDPWLLSCGSLVSITSLPLSKTEEEEAVVEEEEEEVVSDERPKPSRSLSKITSSSIVRTLSKSKNKLFRKKNRRRGTPLPTTHEQAGFIKEGAQPDHETRTDAGKHARGPLVEPLLPMSSIRSRPRKSTILASTPRVRQLPREKSLANISDTSDDPEGDELPNIALPRTVKVKNRKLVDALKREGIYSGTIDRETDLPDGYGSMAYIDGSHYKGHFQQGDWHGKATFRNKDGDVYNGYFVKNKKDGTGILKWGKRDGQYEKFEGRFEDDMIREGKMLYAKTGSFYEGLFVGGRRHGFGMHKSSDGYEFQGQWFNDKMHGHGKVILPCGGWYNGDFKSGVAHGFGMEVSSTGEVQHEGRWDSGYPVLHRGG
eukprot:scaffold2597_cov116-Cylindrotheca_fusiformis.AAC.7